MAPFFSDSRPAASGQHQFVLIRDCGYCANTSLALGGNCLPIVAVFDKHWEGALDNNASHDTRRITLDIFMFWAL